MNVENQIAQMTKEETREMALACLIELTDTDAWDVIKELCLGDVTFTEELIAQLEGS